MHVQSWCWHLCRCICLDLSLFLSPARFISPAAELTRSGVAVATKPFYRALVGVGRVCKCYSLLACNNHHVSQRSTLSGAAETGLRLTSIAVANNSASAYDDGYMVKIGEEKRHYQPPSGDV